MQLTELSFDDMQGFASMIAKGVRRHLLPPVTKVELFLTEACNLRCDYCFVATKKAYKRMSLETAEKAIDLLMRESRDEKEVHITLFGGEPLLAFPLMKHVAEYAQQRVKELGKKVWFACTTNATLLTEEHVYFARQHGFLYLLSIDGEKEVHDKHRIWQMAKEVLTRLKSDSRCSRVFKVGWVPG